MSGNPLLDALEDILSEPIEGKSENEPQKSETKEEKREAPKEDTCEKGTCPIPKEKKQSPIPKVKTKRKAVYTRYWKCRECDKEGDLETPFCSEACKKKAIARAKRELERLEEQK